MPLKRTSQNQFEIMIDFLERNQNVLNTNFDSLTSKKKYKIAWDVLTSILNSDDSGPTKSVDKWKKTLRDWKMYVKSKAARISKASQSQCINDGQTSKEFLSALEERLANLLGLTIVDRNEEVEFPSDGEGDIIQEPGCSSLKRELEREEDCDSGLLYNSKQSKIGKKNFISNLNKRKKQKIFRKAEFAETLINDNEDGLMQARLVEAEEQKADALQRMATSFESIATSVEFLCHTLLEQK